MGLLAAASLFLTAPGGALARPTPTIHPGGMPELPDTVVIDFAARRSPSLLALRAVGPLGADPASAGSDSAPCPTYDGAFVYVGTNAGRLKAIRVSNGAVISHTPASGAGAVRGMPWWLSYDVISVATPDTIIFVRNATVHSVGFDGTSFSTNWTKTLTWTPSAPVDDGAGNLYFGGSDGKLHRLAVSDGTDLAQVPTTAILGSMGEPSINWDRGVIHVGGSDGHVYTFDVGF